MSQLPLAAAAIALLPGAASPQPLADHATYEAPAQPWRDTDDAQTRCRDRIHHVRDAAGKPELDRKPAEPDKPLLIYAVDHRIDGCGVLVPAADPGDIRQSPEPGPAKLIPAR